MQIVFALQNINYSTRNQHGHYINKWHKTRLQTIQAKLNITDSPCYLKMLLKGSHCRTLHLCQLKIQDNPQTVNEELRKVRQHLCPQNICAKNGLFVCLSYLCSGSCLELKNLAKLQKKAGLSKWCVILKWNISSRT